MCAMVFSFCVAYVAFRHFQTPLPMYYPTLHKWSVTDPPVKAPAMGWYSLFGASLACSLAIAGVVWFAAKQFLGENKNYSALMKISSLLTGIAVLFMAVFNCLHEYHSWISKSIH